MAIAGFLLAVCPALSYARGNCGTDFRDGSIIDCDEPVHKTREREEAYVRATGGQIGAPRLTKWPDELDEAVQESATPQSDAQIDKWCAIIANRIDGRHSFLQALIKDDKETGWLERTTSGNASAKRVEEARKVLADYIAVREKLLCR